MSSPTGHLPTSNALAEANPDSIGELMSRDPEAYSDPDIDKIVLLQREQRARQAQAEAQGAKLPRAARAQAPLVPVTEEDDIQV